MTAVEELGLGDWVDGLPAGLDTRVGSARRVPLQPVSVSWSRSSGRGSPTPTCWCSTRRRARWTRPWRCGSTPPWTASRRGRTSVTIAHRMSTAERADVVVVMDQGGSRSSAGTQRSSPRVASTVGCTPPGSPSTARLRDDRHREPLDPELAARLKRDADGLVAAVVQQHDTLEVLMVGWMDDEALHRTLTTGRTTFWSRSRQEYWVKGETSGHRQWVKEVRLDCDGDTLLVLVDQEGPACHTGTRTCFDTDVLSCAADGDVTAGADRRSRALRPGRPARTGLRGSGHGRGGPDVGDRRPAAGRGRGLRGDAGGSGHRRRRGAARAAARARGAGRLGRDPGAAPPRSTRRERPGAAGDAGPPGPRPARAHRSRRRPASSSATSPPTCPPPCGRS